MIENLEVIRLRRYSIVIRSLRSRYSVVIPRFAG